MNYYSSIGFRAPANTIAPATYGGAVAAGIAVDLAGALAASFRVNVGAALAAPVTFTFQDSDTGSGGWATMACQGMCDDVATNLTLTVSQLDADYDATKGKICEVAMCCPRRYVRAISSAGGNYSVTVERSHLASSPR